VPNSKRINEDGTDIDIICKNCHHQIWMQNA